MKTKQFAEKEIWFVTGSQHLYGPETLKKVAANSQEIAGFLNDSEHSPVSIIFKPVLTNPDSIRELFMQANHNDSCIGIVTWMHTFSPSKMWIAGLKMINKPILHLHTQYNRDLPWGEIDMDFMNLNQAAHGDREHGYIYSRMRKNRKVVAGYWKEENVQSRLGIWMRAALAWDDLQNCKIARIGDNMREVAVTEGDKVEAQIQFGYSVNTFGIGDLVQYVEAVGQSDINDLLAVYDAQYILSTDIQKDGVKRKKLADAAKIELGMRNFLKAGNFKAFTTTFEDLHGLTQLPGLAVQRLMADGYGFGGEGDWKTSALVRALKTMAAGLKGGTSFMEDYTYHLHPSGAMVLGAHMLEVCESIASEKPRLEMHPLGIGGKDDPARLIFGVQQGPAINLSCIDMGDRFRFILNDVDVIDAPERLPKLPVAHAVWIPKPNLQIASESWIYAGGAHHTVFSQALNSEYIRDFAEIASTELVVIDSKTQVSDLKNELKWNDIYYSFRK